MDNKPVVGIIGGTGGLGRYITTALLSGPFRNSFAAVKLLSRTGEPDKELEDLGATWVKYNEANLAASLAGIGVLICTIGSAPAAKKFRDVVLVPAIAATPDISVYIPSEFGADHTSHFHDFVHPEWAAKDEHLRLAAEAISAERQLKICAVYIGLFLEDSVGPWFGFDTAHGAYEAVGSADFGVSFTAREDVGRAVAALAAMPAKEVPTKVRLAGDTKSMRQIAEIMEKSGAGDIEVTEIDFGVYKKWALENVAPDPARPLRFLMGQGGLRHENGDGGLGNDNELVNPGQQFWTWRTLEDLARETGGRPWAEGA